MRDVNWTRGESKRLILTCAIVWMLLGGMLAPVAVGAPDTTTANTTTGTVASGGSVERVQRFES